MTSKLLSLATIAVFAAAIGCSKSDKSAEKTPAPAAEKAPVPAAEPAPTQAAPEAKTDAKLLALKFHHDN